MGDELMAADGFGGWTDQLPGAGVREMKSAERC